MFCSTSVTQHILRGIAAALLLAGSIFLFRNDFGWLGLGAIAGALVLMRGCPMCWLAGLYETLANRRKAGEQRAEEAAGLKT